MSLVFFSCSKPTVEKPEILVHEDQMIDMLVDIHLAEATLIHAGIATRW